MNKLADIYLLSDVVEGLLEHREKRLMLPRSCMGSGWCGTSKLRLEEWAWQEWGHSTGGMSMEEKGDGGEQSLTGY